MAKTDLCIDVLGTSFSLTVDEDPLYLEGLLAHYNTIIDNAKKISNMNDPLKIAILAGIQLCDELEKLSVHENSGERVRESELMKHTVNSLIEKIDCTISAASGALASGALTNGTLN